ncbi:MAG: DUF3592 domain-containing protein [Verrucomicrobiota bacterium]
MAFESKQYREGAGGFEPTAPGRRKKSGWTGGVAMGLFALFWSAIVMVFNGFIGYGIYKNVQAQDFLETTGVVTHSEVDRRSDSDGTTYSADIRYDYEVKGQTYTHDKHAYGAMGSSDYDLAHGVVRRFAEGKEVTVYYNPADPQDAVLDRSFESIPWFMLLFLTPFNLVMLGLWAGCGYGVYRALFGKEEGTVGGHQVEHRGFQTRVKIGQGSPLITGMVGIGIVSFIAIFPIAFLGLTNNYYALIGAAVLMGAAGIFGAVWQAGRNASGKGDLVIDRTAMKLIVPPTKGFGEPTELSLMELNTVGVKRVSNSKNSTQFAPTVTYLDQNEIRQEVLLCQWSDEAAAEELADWLRQELGLPTPGA